MSQQQSNVTPGELSIPDAIAAWVRGEIIQARKGGSEWNTRLPYAPGQGIHFDGRAAYRIQPKTRTMRVRPFVAVYGGAVEIKTEEWGQLDKEYPYPTLSSHGWWVGPIQEIECEM